jgi:hypothetical protein
MTKITQLGKHATVVLKNDKTTSVIYHETPVVKFNNYKITLNSGGYKTATTKTRMNQASNEFDLGFRVYQQQKKWYVEYNNQTLNFVDNMVLSR